MATITNPLDLLAWAINTGRARAADQALWTARLTGPGADAYADQLLGRGVTYGNRTTPTTT